MIVKDSQKLKQEAEQIIREEKAEWQREQAEAQRQRDAATIAPDAGRDVTQLRAQIGRAMQGNEIRKRLKKLNPMLRFEVSLADPAVTGIYIGSKFLCGMETGPTPEFSIRHNPSGFVMRGETRGWRTVLAMLIRGGIIGRKEAEDAFQILFSSTESANWQRILQ